MTTASWLAMAPLLVLSGGAVLLMMLVSIRRGVGLGSLVATLSSLGAALSCIPASRAIPQEVTPLLLADGYALFFTALFCLCGFVTAVVARDYLRSRPEENEEFFLLLLLSILGAAVLAYANHFASLLMGMELLAVSLYALIAYPNRQVLPLEAAIKYLVLSGAASAIFVFGFALLYTAVGTLEFDAIGVAINAVGPDTGPLLMAAAVMIVGGLAFKLSLVPFHMWTPDVYEGAPAPIAGFMASVSKAAFFVALLRWWMASSLYELPGLLWVVSLLAAASMLVGNLLALRQDNVKRILAYSSIAHVGYLLIVLVACTIGPSATLAMEAAIYYLVAYSLTSLAAFSVLGLLSRASVDRELDSLADLKGLFWRQPGLSLLFTVSVLSLAGIPLTAGFIGKFYLFSAGVAGAQWGLLSVLVIGSAIGIYYYLRIIFRMTVQVEAGEPGADGEVSWPVRVTCAGLVLAVLYFGVIPGPLMALLRTIL